MNKVYFLMGAVILGSCASNKATSAKQDATKPVVFVEVPDEEVMLETEVYMIDVPVEAPPIRDMTEYSPGGNIRFNSNYSIAGRINDKYDLFWVERDPEKSNHVGVVDKEGNVILPNLFYKYYSQPSNYELMLGINRKAAGLFNLNELRWTIPMSYTDINSLRNNLFAVKKGVKWGVVDNYNNTIISIDWDNLQQISQLENYLIVTKENLKGIYSLFDKKLTVPCEFTSLEKLDRGNNFLVSKGNRYNIVDINNRPLFKTWYDEIVQSRTNTDYFIVKLNDKYGVIDHQEKVIVPPIYLEFNSSSYSDGSYLAKNKDGKYGFMLIDGRVTLPFQYDNLRRGYNSNVISIMNGKCGLVRVNSGVPTEIVTCEFDNIREGSKLFVVEKGGKMGLMDQYGKQVTAIEYETIDTPKESYYGSSNTIFIAKKGKRFVVLNELGQQVTEEDYLHIEPIYRNNPNSSIQYVYLKFKHKNNKFGVVDKVGKVVVNPQFDDITGEDDNILIVELKNKSGLFSLLGKKLIVNHEYDNLIKNENEYIGFKGNELDIISIKSDQVVVKKASAGNIRK